MQQEVKQKNKAFVLLYAVLVSSLVLAVGISLISIALKQLSLSASGRESQYAFYASNTGIECALYWDFVGTHEESAPVFPLNDTTETIFDGTAEQAKIECAGSIITAQDIEGGSVDTGDYFFEEGNLTMYKGTDSATTTFAFRLTNTDYCVEVTVEKYLQDGEHKTAVESRGYNTCDENNSRRVERGLRVTY